MPSSELEKFDDHRSFGGWQRVYAHDSAVLGCRMRFGIYMPPQVDAEPRPVLYWLSGLTCTEQNFLTKAHAQRHAAEHGLVVVAPDTSPRGDEVADDEAWDLGTGASFYVDATEEPWARHYRMETYVVEELVELVESHFPVLADRRGISGHSMGGHGALTLAFKHPDRYRSLSAFAPIAAPSRSPWGEKAFTAYLGENREPWRAHDATSLVRTTPCRLPALVDQGEADQFLDSQLKPSLFAEACEAVGYPLELRFQPGYDHSYYFVSTFLGDHFAHHARGLAA